MARADNQNLPEQLNEIYHIEYFLEFTPIKKQYSTTKYAIDFNNYEVSGKTYITASLYYEDIELTLLKTNIKYNISLYSREILGTGNSDHDNYIKATHSELFLDQSDFNNSPDIRIDETLTFSDYFKEYQYPSAIRSEVTFNYVGIEIYKKNLLYNFTTYHFNASHLLWSEGDY